MRCGCPECGSFMIHSERDHACVCPECLARCYACQGTGTALTKEAVQSMKRMAEIKTTAERMQDARKQEQ